MPYLLRRAVNNACYILYAARPTALHKYYFRSRIQAMLSPIYTCRLTHCGPHTHTTGTSTAKGDRRVNHRPEQFNDTKPRSRKKLYTLRPSPKSPRGAQTVHTSLLCASTRWQPRQDDLIIPTTSSHTQRRVLRTRETSTNDPPPSPPHPPNIRTTLRLTTHP